MLSIMHNYVETEKSKFLGHEYLEFLEWRRYASTDP